MYRFYMKDVLGAGHVFPRCSLAMKLTAILLFVVAMQVQAIGWAQHVTLRKNKVTIKHVFKEIKRQTGYDVFYIPEFFDDTKYINADFKNTPARIAIESCISSAGGNLTVTLHERTFVIQRSPIKMRPTAEQQSNQITVRGKIVNDKGEALGGVLVTIKGSNRSTATANDGVFTLNNVDRNVTLAITLIGHLPREVKAVEDIGTVVLVPSNSTLDEVQIIAYGTTTKRLNTGSVGSVKAETIEKQPVGNVLTALTGRVPGLDITQQTGVPGGAVRVRIRGQNSLSASANDPLFLIDGVPFLNNATTTTSQSTYRPPAGGNSSPFNSLNPADIESVEVLKDADATAIYGSRGANGVVLITTKKGKAGQSRLDLNMSTGFGKLARKMDVLNRRDYLDMRYEALRNDNMTTETTSSAVYDLTVWDTTRSTDWQDELIGNTAEYTNLQATLSGGDKNTNYAIAGNYWKETTVFPGDFADTKGSARVSLQHRSSDNRLSAQFTGNFLRENNNLPANDLLNAATTLPPVAPPLLLPDGNLNFDGTNFFNPLASLRNTYDAKGTNLNTNGLISYEILKGLVVKANMGYSNFRFKTLFLNPESAQNPAYFAGPSSRLAEFGDHTTETWNVEPQLGYKTRLFGNQIDVLLGTTFQNTVQEGLLNYTSGYVDDVLMRDRSLATSTSANTSYSEYRYNALFLRVNYNIKNKYIANVTARRDGSSRFGSGKQFGNFGAIGAAWLFSEEAGVKDALPFLSFGKLRASYGITGSDAVGNYGYLSLYRAASTNFPYYGANGAGLRPSNLYNTEFQWESNRKMDLALEFGFLDNRFLLNVNYYRNRSSNQLVGYPISAVAGFTSIPFNLPATVQNTGLELELNSTNITKANFSWSSSFNVTVPRNKLIDYPSLASSSNANMYILHEPLTIAKVFPTLGIDPQTGVMVYQNRFGDPITNIMSLTALDQTQAVNTGRDFFGGFLNTFTYKRLQLDLFLHFSQQYGLRYNVNGVYLPGSLGNIPQHVYDGRWQYEGQSDALYNKLSQNSTSAAAQARARNTDAAAYEDIFFLRLKNVSLSYQLNPTWTKKWGMQNFRIYMQGQNLATITNYQGMDPENTSLSIAPLAVTNFGVQLTF
ncbi:SusC/RagA family TonB-linked outer membrane protein [Sphingobacterium olei]|uniref:SusC/RagA family TonB-linked outer membrane protein n=1 Tax=Sphingobacterium olei TaxID=2571155 RepID=A0A4U0NHN0_9SPHI|nr:SusC/RagA family TonB-linked outer membrane protein [Sphingobacterium olei]TJZ53727.1 SusC/RagA family TonB-linked outer membrane protein [Sphingobacterium olei]